MLLEDEFACSEEGDLHRDEGLSLQLFPPDSSSSSQASPPDHSLSLSPSMNYPLLPSVFLLCTPILPSLLSPPPFPRTSVSNRLGGGALPSQLWGCGQPRRLGVRVWSGGRAGLQEVKAYSTIPPSPPPATWLSTQTPNFSFFPCQSTTHSSSIFDPEVPSHTPDPTILSSGTRSTQT